MLKCVTPVEQLCNHNYVITNPDTLSPVFSAVTAQHAVECMAHDAFNVVIICM